MGSSGGPHTESSGAPRRLRILHVLPQDQNRGAQVYAGRLRDALRGDAGQDHILVTIFSGLPGGANPDDMLNITPGIGRRVLDLRAVWSLRKLIRRRDADVVVAHGGEALKYVVPASGRRPTVYYKVGLSTAEVERPIHRRLYRVLSRRTSCVVGNSHDILEQVGRVFGVPQSRQALIPNARDPELYRPLRGAELPADPPRLLFVGQLEPGKRPELFLDVVELLRSSVKPFDVMMAGDGPLRAALQERAKRLGVKLMGTRSDIPELMRASAVIVMTSAPTTEGMPGVLIEAGLSGVPTVSTEAAGVRDIIQEDVTGSISSSDPSHIAERVGVLLTRPELRRTQGEAAREHCLNHFVIARTAEQWRELVDRLVSDQERCG